tara:strand:+ start:431 stop:601 length:171 start_codon:yes stop_codon:yes gene_type:complete
VSVLIVVNAFSQATPINKKRSFGCVFYCLAIMQNRSCKNRSYKNRSYKNRSGKTIA